MNDSKSEVIIFGSTYQLSKLDIDSIVIGNNSVKLSSTVKYLGAWLDQGMTMADHVNHKCKTAFYHLFNIRRCMKFLDRSSAIALVNALVHSCIDYCNVLLAGVTNINVKKLQRVQNYAARLVTRSNRFTPSLYLLQNLHWLPVSYRIRFKILILVYKSLHNMAPLYLTEMFHYKQTSYRLRSQNHLILYVPKSKLTYGDRSLQISGSKLWNDLPLSIKSAQSLKQFHTLLKTHFFNCAFKSSS